MNKYLLPLLCLLVTFCNSPEEATPSIPIMIDGQFAPHEWTDATSIAIDGANTLFAKQDSHYFYLAVKSQLPKPLYIDLFVERGEMLTNIHASSQLGHRTLPANGWDDYTPETRWGYHDGWLSNTVLFDRKKAAELRKSNPDVDIYAETFIPYEGMEFQFYKRKWALDGAKIRIEIRSMLADGFETVAFPANTSRDKSDNWAVIFP